MNDAFLGYLESVNSQNWNEFLASDRELARIELTISRAAKLMASESRSSVIYAEAQKEFQKALNARGALFMKRYRKP